MTLENARSEKSFPARLYLVAVACFLGISLFVYTRSAHNSPGIPDRGTEVGRFWIPPLAGWKKTVYEDMRISNVKYAKRTERAVVTSTFTFWEAPPDEPSPTLRTIREDVNRWLKHEKSLPNASLPGAHFSTKKVKFRSWPGFLTIVSKRDENAQVQIRYLHFTDGKSKYMLSMAVEGTPPFDEANELQAAAWGTLTQKMRLRDSQETVNSR